MTDNEAMVAHYRAVRLPEPLTTFVGSLSAAECSAVCDGLAEAFADAGVTVHSTRFDSMHSVGTRRGRCQHRRPLTLSPS